jgi:CBS domain-containing protein
MTVRYKDDLTCAYNRMKREGFRHLLVIDDQGEFVGIISDRDFQRAMWPMSHADAHGLPEGPKFPIDAKVGSYMSRPVKSLPDDTELITVVNLMIDQKISAVAVTRDSEICGIITHEDLLRVLGDLLRAPTSLQDRLEGLTYNSPLGHVANLLSAAGI